MLRRPSLFLGKYIRLTQDHQKKEKGMTDKEMVGDRSLSKLQEIVTDRGAWSAEVQGVERSLTRLSDLSTTKIIKMRRAFL